MMQMEQVKYYLQNNTFWWFSKKQSVQEYTVFGENSTEFFRGKILEKNLYLIMFFLLIPK